MKHKHCKMRMGSGTVVGSHFAILGFQFAAGEFGKSQGVAKTTETSQVG